MENGDKLLRMRPELKSREDNIALLQALADGTIDTVGTDHAPHTLDEKLARTTFGIPGVEHSLEIMLKAYNSGAITLFRLISSMSSKPAEIFGIKNKGELSLEFDGDITVVSLHDMYIINNKQVVSKCNWTPWNGVHSGGKVLATFVRGHKVYENGNFFEPVGEEIEYGI
jgi:dihydroorotase